MNNYKHTRQLKSTHHLRISLIWIRDSRNNVRSKVTFFKLIDKNGTRAERMKKTVMNLEKLEKIKDKHIEKLKDLYNLNSEVMLI